MKLRWLVPFTAVCASFAALSVPITPPPAAVQEQPPPTQGLITLYAGDETRACFDLDSGTYGTRIHDGELILDDTELVWNLFEAGQISVGYVGDTAATYFDLGDAYVGSLANPRAQSPKPNLSVFHTLRTEKGDIVWSGPPGKVYRARDARGVLRGTPSVGVKHFTPVVGHTYVLRVRGFGRRRGDRAYKLHVIDVQPGHTLTLQWGVL